MSVQNSYERFTEKGKTTMEHLPVAVIVFACLLVVCSSQLQPKAGFNCTAQTTCGACVAESPQCYWCKAPEYFGERCNHWNVLNQTNCSQEHIVSPESEIHATENKTPRNAEPGSTPIQLAPQEVHIKLRPNTPFQFQMNFRQAENYPVDIYFIMDVSHTMKTYTATLATFSHLLVAKIGNITTDFRLGFGSFVDKPILPFTATGINNEILSPCEKCFIPYGFKNELSLTRNESEFKRRVTGLGTSGNLDAPEGGFDAIMQSIVCMEEIGWRNHSRKMILFSTDGSFHYAGDGKLGGIVVPNDGRCHMTSNGYYSESVNQDYPSISQLAQKISEKKVNVIFVVPASQVALYRRLSEHILGSNVGQLANDSSNVIDLVQENYERIRSAVELKTENLEDVQIAFKVKCPTGDVRSFPRCEGLGIGQSVSFNVTINVDSCPSVRSQWKKTFQIYPVGLTEKLTVHLDLICECPCELQDVGIQNSSECSGSGTYECGICTCNRGFYGKKCECGAASLEDDLQYDKPCRLTNTSEVCEGRGKCVCGQCVCDPAKRYSGSHCQCNDFGCDYFRGELCGGPSRGVCKCGECLCHDDYYGSSCDCLNNTAPCMASNGLPCNGKGNCTCGTCECWDVFKGPTCEDCPTCQGKCDENFPCAQCHFRNVDNPCSKCPKTSQVDDFTEMPEWRECRIRDDDLCDIRFIYNYKTNEVKVKRTKECVYRASNLVIILSVIGAVVILGIIALLVWKTLVTIYDNREYKAFVDEQSKAKWDVAQNPVYKPATTNFQNPTYRPSSTINH